MLTQRARLFVTATAIALLDTLSAAAHAPPEIGRIVWNQARDHVALVTNRGLIFGEPGLHDWRILCSDALGVPASEHADSITAAYLPDDRLLVASRSGLQSSANDGCDWQPIAPFADVYISALAQQPTDKGTLYLGVFAAGRGGLYTTRDAGATWTQLLTVPDTDLVSQIVLASSLPARIYTSGPVTDARSEQSKTVVYHIPDGTGGKDWNPKDKPIRVSHGMVLRLIDDDKSTKSGGHWLHTNGQPCSHGNKAIGTGFDCKVNNSAPMGVISGTFEHNVANGIGRVYIEIVAPPAAG